MPDQTPHSDLLALTTEIVSSHVANNTVPQSEISGLIEQVFRTLANLGGGAPLSADRDSTGQPPVRLWPASDGCPPPHCRRCAAR